MRFLAQSGVVALAMVSLGLTLENESNTTQLQALQSVLPACSADCIFTLAPEHGCSPLDVSCGCTNTQLNTAVIACMSEHCTVKETLISLKYSATACDVPVRSQTRLLRGVLWVMFSIATLSIALRFAARAPFFDGPGYGWDDWMMLVVLACLIPHESVLALMVENGLGQDIWMIAPDWDAITTISRCFWIGEMMYTIVVNLTKVSILLLYLRIFPSTVSTWFRTACFVLIAVCVSATIGMVLSVAFECNPVSGAWLRWDGETESKCINTTTQVLAFAAFNIIVDLLVFILPIRNVIKLNASAQKRAGVCLTFLVGLFVTIVSVIRLQKLSVHMTSTNPTWDMTPIAIWSQAEGNVGVVCACMPSFARLVRQAWSATVGALTSKVSTITKSNHHTQKSHADGHVGIASGQSFHIHPPSHGLAKTVETSVYIHTAESMDEIELMEKRPQSISEMGGGSHQHRYRNEW